MGLGDCLGLCTSRRRFAKELVIIYIIQDENPFSNLFILKPVPDELEYISVAVLPPANLGSVGKVAQTFLAAGRITRMDPEDPGVGRLLSNSVAVFDSKSCFPGI